MTQDANHCMQATPDVALLYFFDRVPGAPDADRSATGDGFLINNYDEQRNAVSKMQR